MFAFVFVGVFCLLSAQGGSWLSSLTRPCTPEKSGSTCTKNERASFAAQLFPLISRPLPEKLMSTAGSVPREKNTAPFFLFLFFFFFSCARIIFVDISIVSKL